MIFKFHPGTLGQSHWIKFVVLPLLLLCLSACQIPRVTAEQRIFLNLSLEFLGEFTLPKTTVSETQVGGLSAITYDRDRDLFYTLSDDRGQAHFYTLKLDLDQSNPAKPTIENIAVEQVTFLKDSEGNPYPEGSINPEAIGFSPQQSVFIASEGVNSRGIAPFVNEFDLGTGEWKQSLPLPARYIPDAADGQQTKGVQDNLGFESLTLNPFGYSASRLEPFRIFVATEAPLFQDQEPVTQAKSDSEPPKPKNRLLHYLMGDGPPLLVAEHLYPLNTDTPWSVMTGLTELMSLDQGGHFLSLERSVGVQGYGARIFQVAMGAATDTSGIASLQENPQEGIEPVRKQLLLDLGQLGIKLDNLEGMTLGPRLADGSQSLVLVSDDNFKSDQVTQFLLFRLRQNQTQKQSAV